MSAWEYSALDAQGGKRKGVIEADSGRAARQQLREKGLMPIAVESAHRKSGSNKKWQLSAKVSLRDVTLFTRQLATLVESGLPLEEVLQAIARQTDHKGLNRIIIAVRSRVLEGHTLADALSEFPKTFNELYRAMVDAGEKSGTLGTVLVRLAEHSERLHQLRGKIQLALLYPTALTLVAVAVITLLMTYVVPKVVSQFDHVGQTLPWLTRWMIFISDGLVAYGVFILLALVCVVLFVKWLLSRESRRFVWHRMQLRLPLVAGFIVCQQTLQFARTLGILVGSGLDLLQSLSIASTPVTNLCLRKSVQQASERVREGGSLARSLEQSGGFPPMLIYMIASGEQSGELEQMLIRSAQNQEVEFESRLAWLIGLFEPIIILTMGVIVLAIVLAILLPILQLNNLTGI
ncbi:type II secretion system inner membrane protein GspF [Motiliproteus sp. MSK22-1]|uniref:type II secretion system inner membrane protein GspF n=1 Tax=Motiliproteus sp. MSK22-1 TaxID=1897630 RepID=UPI000977906A|nr:type II secretion system inner membrane protein GspF [Motiliproteus sp. MSK22-1]OMH34791.1 type II secretion system protein GspF [Motiliproteus sp. MSK22-1]